MAEGFAVMGDVDRGSIRRRVMRIYLLASRDGHGSPAQATKRPRPPVISYRAWNALEAATETRHEALCYARHAAGFARKSLSE